MPILGRVSTEGRGGPPPRGAGPSAGGPQTPFIRDPDAEKMRANRDLIGKVVTFFFVIGVIRTLPVFLNAE
jgi:hypothetical protein